MVVKGGVWQKVNDAGIDAASFLIMLLLLMFMVLVATAVLHTGIVLPVSAVAVV